LILVMFYHVHFKHNVLLTPFDSILFPISIANQSCLAIFLHPSLFVENSTLCKLVTPVDLIRVISFSQLIVLMS
jgi:hypothetical protein